MFLLGRVFKIFSKTTTCKPTTITDYESCPKTIPDLCKLYLALKHSNHERHDLFIKNITPLLHCEHDCRQVVEFLGDDKVLSLIVFEKQTLKKIRSDLSIFSTIIKTG